MSPREKQELRKHNIKKIVHSHKESFTHFSSWAPGRRIKALKNVYSPETLLKNYDLMIHFIITNRLYLNYAS